MNKSKINKYINPNTFTIEARENLKHESSVLSCKTHSFIWWMLGIWSHQLFLHLLANQISFQPSLSLCMKESKKRSLYVFSLIFFCLSLIFFFSLNSDLVISCLRNLSDFIIHYGSFCQGNISIGKKK